MLGYQSMEIVNRMTKRAELGMKTTKIQGKKNNKNNNGKMCLKVLNF